MSSKKNPIKGKATKRCSELMGVSENSIVNDKIKRNFVVSFEYLDRNQGQTFEDWEQEGLLVNMLNTLRDYCQKTMEENKSKSFKEYGYFPPKSNFKHPKHVPEDVSWASLHLCGKACLGGHIIENIFYVVFLDKNHEFWLTEKKHT